MSSSLPWFKKAGSQPSEETSQITTPKYRNNADLIEDIVRTNIERDRYAQEDYNKLYVSHAVKADALSRSATMTTRNMTFVGGLGAVILTGGFALAPIAVGLGAGWVAGKAFNTITGKPAKIASHQDEAEKAIQTRNEIRIRLQNPESYLDRVLSISSDSDSSAAPNTPSREPSGMF